MQKGRLLINDVQENVSLVVNATPAIIGHVLSITLTSASVNVTFADGTSSTVSESGTLNNVVRINSVSYHETGERHYEITNPSGVIISASLPYTLVGDNYEITAYSYTKGECLAYDTQVEMADGTFKNLGDIEVGDKVLSIDFDTMKLVSREVIYSGRDEEDYDQWITPDYIENVYSNGTIIKQSMRHRMYNLEEQGYKHLYEWQSGEHGYCIDGTNPTLVEKRIVHTPQHYARITLKDSNNYFANGLSTGDSECPTGIILNRPLERAPQGYTVTVTRINGYSNQDVYDGDNYGTVVGNISQDNVPLTITISSGQVTIQANGDVDNVSCSGGVTFDGGGAGSDITYLVTGNGTITYSVE